jgi:hypothetical protein
MAKQAKAEKAEKPAALKPEETFVNLMMVAAEFVNSRGGIDAAKQALDDTGKFIQHAGGVSQATRALEVLESLRTKIGS